MILRVPTVNHIQIPFLDYVIQTDSSEDRRYGGLRMITFMVYLSDVEAGGHTVFPQAGISVKPVAGSALYWYNCGAQYNYDSRIFHLGCPVLYGSKWIANKWIKMLANYKDYPCLAKKKHFSVTHIHNEFNLLSYNENSTTIAK